MDPHIESLTGRLSSLEQQTHTLSHRMRSIEEERLPARIVTVESALSQIRTDVTAIERISEKVQTLLAEHTLSAAIHQQKLESTLKAAAWVGSSIVVLLQLLPYFKKLIL